MTLLKKNKMINPSVSIFRRLFSHSVMWILFPSIILIFLIIIFFTKNPIVPLEDKMRADLADLMNSSILTANQTNSFEPIIRFSSKKDKYDRIESGWFAQVTEIGGDGHGRAWRSKSINFEQFSVDEIYEGPSMINKKYSNAAEWNLNSVSAIKVLEKENRKFLFTIFADVRTNIEDTEALNQKFIFILLISLTSMSAVVLLGTFFQVKFGLRPLDILRKQITEVKASKRTKMDLPIATEVQPIAEALNDLFEDSDIKLERARHEVGNLAHGLKTPLTIIKDQANYFESEKSVVVINAVQQMERQLRSYLTESRSTVLGKDKRESTNLFNRVEPWRKLLAHYRLDENIGFVNRVKKDHFFVGTTSHLDDILSNLLENATKWCTSKVFIKSTILNDKVTGKTILEILVEDDGPGIPTNDLHRVIERGYRNDYKTPGNGLGLDIVRRIATDYGGNVFLGKSKAGGLLVKVRLPGSKASKI